MYSISGVDERLWKSILELLKVDGICRSTLICQFSEVKFPKTTCCCHPRPPNGETAIFALNNSVIGCPEFQAASAIN